MKILIEELMSGGVSPIPLFSFAQTQSPRHDMLLKALDGGKSTAPIYYQHYKKH